MSEIRLSDFARYYTSNWNHDDYNAFEKYDLNSDGVVNDKDVELAPNEVKANQIRSILNYSVDENSSIDEDIRETDYNGVPLTTNATIADDINQQGTVYILVSKGPDDSTNASSCSGCVLLSKELAKRKDEINDVAAVYTLEPIKNANYKNELKKLGCDEEIIAYPAVLKFVDGKFVEVVQNRVHTSASTLVQRMIDKAEGQRDENADKILGSENVDHRGAIFKTAISELNVTSLRKRIAYEAAMGDEFYQNLSSQIQKNMSTSKWNEIKAQIKEHEDAKKAHKTSASSDTQNTAKVNDENKAEAVKEELNNQNTSVQNSETKTASGNNISFESLQNLFSRLFEMFSQLMANFSV